MKQKLTYIHSLYELYEMLSVIVLTLSICFVLDDILSLGMHNLSFILCASFWIFLFRFMEENWRKVMAYVILLGLFFFIFAFLQILKIPFGDLLVNTSSYGFGSYVGENLKLYSLLFIGFITLCVSIGSYLVYKIEIFRLLLSGIFFLSLILLPILHINLKKISLFFILFFLLMNLAAICQRKAKNNTFSLYLMPFFLIMSFFIILFPTKEEPLQWRFVHSFIDGVSELTDHIITSTKLQFGDNSEYNIAFTGYSETGDLGGAVTPTERIQLRANGEKANQSVYLIGSIYDYYSGNGWEKTLNEKTVTADYETDIYELLSALYKNNSSVADTRKLLNISKVQLMYQDINTKTLFYPQKTFLIDTNNSYKYINAGPNLLFKKFYWKDILYRTRFFVIDYDDPIMENICRNNQNVSNSPSNADVLQFTKDCFGATNGVLQSLESSQDTHEYLTKRADEIKENYTQLPSTLPQEVKNLALSLTDGFDNDYDKAKAIERYLNTLAYSYDPGIPKNGEDYVDYFLFTSKSGYCTYFASAMAVLLRSIDIPSRYVEGFVLDYHSIVSNGVYQIPASSSHAWCEVYFEGIGWIPFEPTSVNVDLRYQPFEKEDLPSGTQATGQPTNIIPVINQINNQIAIEKEAKDLKPIFSIICYLLLFAFAFLFVYFLLLRFKRIKRYKKSDTNEQIILELLQIIKIVELRYFIKAENLTVTQLFKMLEPYVPVSKREWIEVKDIYMKIRYSPYQSDIKQVAVYRKIQLSLQNDYLSNCGIFKKINFKMFHAI